MQRITQKKYDIILLFVVYDSFRKIFSTDEIEILVVWCNKNSVFINSLQIFFIWRGNNSFRCQKNNFTFVTYHFHTFMFLRELVKFCISFTTIDEVMNRLNRKKQFGSLFLKFSIIFFSFRICKLLKTHLMDILVLEINIDVYVQYLVYNVVV